MATRRSARNVALTSPSGERCWKCNLIKRTVRLRANDDRMCDECDDANDKLLQQIRAEKGIPSPPVIKQKPSNATRTVNSNGKIGEMATYITKLESEIGKLKDIIASQSTSINQLSVKLNFVLSYLEIDTDNGSSNVLTDNAGETIQPSSASSPPVDRNSNNTLSTRRITATTAAVAAVYMEQQSRRRRASTLIVSGLSVNNSLSDQESFIKLCQNEFATKPDVVFNKRLGKETDNKIRPLLVCFRNEADAQQILDRARELRKSNNEAIRTKVYINPNRTRAEAEAEYQLRCKRRQSRANKNLQATSANDQAMPLPVVQPVSTVQDNSQQQQQQTDNNREDGEGDDPEGRPRQPAPST